MKDHDDPHVSEESSNEQETSTGSFISPEMMKLHLEHIQKALVRFTHSRGLHDEKPISISR